MPGAHDAVHGDAFPGLDQNQVADVQRFNRNDLLVLTAPWAESAFIHAGAIRQRLPFVALTVHAALQQGRLSRGQQHQLTDAVTGPFHGESFQGFAQAEKHNHGGGFAVLADDESAHRG